MDVGNFQLTLLGPNFYYYMNGIRITNSHNIFELYVHIIIRCNFYGKSNYIFLQKFTLKSSILYLMKVILLYRYE